jgi:hypothetical protein
MTSVTNVNLITVSLAILAFLVAFYALIARERKTPYLTNRIYSAVFFVIFGVLLESSSIFVPTSRTKQLHSLAVATFLLALAWTAWTIVIIHNRHVHMRTDRVLRNLWLVRQAKQAYRIIKPAVYEHKPPTPSKELLNALSNLKPPLGNDLPAALDVASGTRGINLSVLATLHSPSVTQSDQLILDLAAAFLDSNHPVQFVTCIRHPIEFVSQLHKRYQSSKGNWQQIAKLLFVVDAFTPHFGFTDSIHDELKSKLQRDLNVKYVRSADSYAGIHSSAGKTFNLIKKALGSPRTFTLVIYEGCHALVDLESREQYRLFVRHVFPSETVWGGMLTVFAEFDIAGEDLDLLRMYSDLFVENSDSSATPVNRGTS